MVAPCAGAGCNLGGPLVMHTMAPGCTLRPQRPPAPAYVEHQCRPLCQVCIAVPLTSAEVAEVEDYVWTSTDHRGNVLVAADDVIRLCRQLLGRLA